ncbi:hypothetical protein ACIBHX_46605 [Nonomuraea sp. NPDC050536]|uniref:hypothetical protein n=1 Tax=Nonomuraea sp. NPDC050536 TaxID=3364366 RepID=UPI0037CBD976
MSQSKVIPAIDPALHTCLDPAERAELLDALAADLDRAGHTIPARLVGIVAESERLLVDPDAELEDEAWMESEAVWQLQEQSTRPDRAETLEAIYHQWARPTFGVEAAAILMELADAEYSLAQAQDTAAAANDQPAKGQLPLARPPADAAISEPASTVPSAPQAQSSIAATQTPVADVDVEAGGQDTGMAAQRTTRPSFTSRHPFIWRIPLPVAGVALAAVVVGPTVLMAKMIAALTLILLVIAVVIVLAVTGGGIRR